MEEKELERWSAKLDKVMKTLTNSETDEEAILYFTDKLATWAKDNIPRLLAVPVLKYFLASVEEHDRIKEEREIDGRTKNNSSRTDKC